MYLATTRCLVTKKARQLNLWNQRLLNCSAVESLNPMKYILVPGPLRFDQHHVSYKVFATGISHIRTPQEPLLYSARADKTLIMPCLKRPTDTFDSPYSISTACLGPFIDGRHWFAEGDDPQGIIDKAGELSKKEKALDLNIETDSLENVRKRIKDENVKNRDVPPSVEKKK